MTLINERTLTVLSTLYRLTSARPQQWYSVRFIAEQAGLPKTTTHRILRSLESDALVRQDVADSYSVRRSGAWPESVAQLVLAQRGAGPLAELVEAGPAVVGPAAGHSLSPATAVSARLLSLHLNDLASEARGIEDLAGGAWRRFKDSVDRELIHIIGRGSMSQPLADAARATLGLANRDEPEGVEAAVRPLIERAHAVIVDCQGQVETRGERILWAALEQLRGKLDQLVREPTA